jgi:glutaryl-CoA dehydrogenase
MLKFKPAIKPNEPNETASTNGNGKHAETEGREHTVAPFDRSIDFYDLDDLLMPDEREIRHKVRHFVDTEISPYITPYWENYEDAIELLLKMRSLGICGAGLEGPGCPKMSAVACGMIALELARGDASIATMYGVTSGLCMTSIAFCGSDEQKQRWLPKLASMEHIGAFALTEPLVGSDASHIQTTARRDGDHYVLNGTKRWIGAATIADVIVVWAQDDQTGQVGGFVVEKGTPGFTATKIQHKLALRALPNADIVFENCRIPVENKLAKARSFKDTAAVLRATRLGVAWMAVGVAQAAYELALDYAKKRTQFGRPIAGFQLIQQKLVHMLRELEFMKITTWRLCKLQDAGKLSDGQASLAKQNNAAKAREVVALARELMGGNGILLDRHVARFFADTEAIYSYEGTNEVNTLVVGREITGMQAFA